MKVLARRPDKTKLPVKKNDKFAFEGTDTIEFEDEDEVLHFFLPVDYAHVEDDSSRKRQMVRRFFYSERGKHYLLLGVPWGWLNSAPAGKLVIDPTVSVATAADVFLDSEFNENGSPHGLIVGKANSKKRTLIKFDLSTAGISSNAVIKAQMRLRYYGKVTGQRRLGGPYRTGSPVVCRLG